MARTWQRSIAGLLAAGLLVLGACGGDDDDKAKDDKAKDSKDQAATEATDNKDNTATSGPQVDKNAPAAGTKFCKDAIAMIARSMNPNDRSTNEEQLAAAAKLDPPDEISDAWGHLISTQREISKLDPKDPTAAQKASEAAQKVAADQVAIQEYLGKKCGIVELNPTSSGSGDGSTVTTG
jgi:hypothetical protein